MIITIAAPDDGSYSQFIAKWHFRQKFFLFCFCEFSDVRIHRLFLHIFVFCDSETLLYFYCRMNSREILQMNHAHNANWNNGRSRKATAGTFSPEYFVDSNMSFPLE